MLALELFCGGGGSGMGYRRAGFRLIGADRKAYHADSYGKVGRFVHADWKDALARYGDSVDLIHASPPCQHYTKLSKNELGGKYDHPDLIGEVRDALAGTGVPYVIENVAGAPLRYPVMLCGWAFGYETYRHRYFETSFHVRELPHLPHETPGCRSPRWEPGTFICVAGKVTPIWKAREVMDIYWMSRSELVESVPPYMTEYIGREAKRAILSRRSGAELAERE